MCKLCWEIRKKRKEIENEEKELKEVKKEKKEIEKCLEEETKSKNDDKKKHNVMFLCNHNSCRSQMAEGWLRHLCKDKSVGVALHVLSNVNYCCSAVCNVALARTLLYTFFNQQLPQLAAEADLLQFVQPCGDMQAATTTGIPS